VRNEFRLKRPLLRDAGFGLVGAIVGGVITGVLYTPAYGVLGALVFGVVFSMVWRFTRPAEPQHAINPISVLRSDRAAVVYAWLLGAGVGAAFGGFVGFSGTDFSRQLVFDLTPAQQGFLGAAVGTILGGAGLGLMVQATSAWGHFVTARVWLALKGYTPRRLIAFLDDAHRLGVLRVAGAHYQFRHALLQDHLASSVRDLVPENRTSRF
jgi:hypothetical protein